MLTADLVCMTVRKGKAHPRFLDLDDAERLALAEALVDAFRRHVGLRRIELEEELKDLLGDGTAFLLHRGLAKLLFDRCELEVRSGRDPEELRRSAFEGAARRFRAVDTVAPDLESIAAEVASELQLDPADLSRGLYADLKEERVIASFDAPSPGELLRRYNVALAQAVLLRASELTIALEGESLGRYRALFRSIRFHQLMHRLEGDGRAGWRIVLDGPLSLFDSAQKYGLQMASFLPTLLHCERWKLTASLGRGAKAAILELEPDPRLLPTGRLRGQWAPEELDWFAQQFRKLESDWEIESAPELLDLDGRGVLVADHLFVHRATGTKVWFEVFGYWRKRAVDSRLALLRECAPKRVILGVSKALAADKKATLPTGVEVYAFKNVPIAREVAALLERFVRS